MSIINAEMLSDQHGTIFITECIIVDCIHIIQFNEGKYEGNIKNNKRYGKGKLIYNNRSIYEGNWKDDKKDGYGKMTFRSGDIYEGNWKNNKLHGKGKRTLMSGKIFYEFWNQGEIIKYKAIFPSGEIVESSYDKYKLTLPDGTIFEEGVQEELITISGRFKATYPDGSIYKGKFKNGKRQGWFKVYKNNTVNDVYFVNDIETEKSSQCNIM